MTRHYPNRTGQFGVIRTKGFTGAVIRLMTRSQVNHAYIYVDNETVVEAKPQGARLTKVRNFGHDDLKAESSFLLTPSERARLASIARGMVGTPYGFLDIVALLFLILGFRWQWLLDRAQTSHTLICSQLVDRVYTLAGLHLYNDNRPDGQVTPGDLLLYLAQGKVPNE